MPALLNRGKHTLTVDLKSKEGQDLVWQLVEKADGLIEGYRPGVMEKLGLGPDVCLQRNPKLVYGRMTGWGQTGPWAEKAGHDINYLSLSGALSAIGTERPTPPLNLVADYGGGGMLLAFGMVTALLAVARGQTGTVVDAAMVEGASLLMTPIYELLHSGLWEDRRHANLLDGSAPFYTVYRTADDKFMAVGALEPKFYQQLLEGLGLSTLDLPPQYDRRGWGELRRLFTFRFSQQSRAEWEQVFADTDACVTPVLSLDEASNHSHAWSRSSFWNSRTGPLPVPAPRFGNPLYPQLDLGPVLRTPPSAPRYFDISEFLSDESDEPDECDECDECDESDECDEYDESDDWEQEEY